MEKPNQINHETYPEWGRQLRKYLYELVRDGDYDIPSGAEYEEELEIDWDEPFHKRIVADFLISSGEMVMLSCAASEEIPSATDGFSRNYIVVETPLEKDEHGDALLIDSIKIFINEVSGEIGVIERAMYPAGKFKRIINMHNPKTKLINDEGRPDIHRLIEAASHKEKTSNNEPLTLDEYARVQKVLGSIDPSDKV